MRKDCIYISGKISGTDLEKTKQKFIKAQSYLYNKAYVENTEVDVVNPTLLDLTFKDSWLKCMIICLWHLLYCNSIYMLKDWKESDGACLEYWVAKKLGFKIYYQK